MSRPLGLQSITGYQRAVGNGEVGRLLTQAVARHGMTGSSQILPHLGAIQPAFGAHDVAGIPAYVGGPASAATAALGTTAYAADGRIAFGDSPSVHEAAHEAAHVIQRRRSGADPHAFSTDPAENERRADAVADRVARGESAADLLPSCGPETAPAAPAAAAVQGYQRLDPMTSRQPYDLVSDDGNMAVKDHSREAWADDRLIEAANKTLKAIKSKAMIVPSGESLLVETPHTTLAAKSLSKFKLFDLESGTELSLTADCGTAAQEMLGSGATGQSPDLAFRGITANRITDRANYQMDDQSPGGALSTVEQMSTDVYVHIFETERKQKLSRDEALKAWTALTDAERRELSARYGINEYAVPKTGQGITIGSEYDMPGFQKGSSGLQFPFHFGFNLMASGHDYVTAESYAGSTAIYYFDMYGPQSKGQAWAQDPSNTTHQGSQTTSMVVDHAAAFEGKIDADFAHFMDDPAKYDPSRALMRGTTVTVIRRGVKWMKVQATSGRYAGKSGWILNSKFRGAK